MTHSRLVVIPARAGSKRIRNKNMYEFDGVPALHRTIELLISSELFSEIAVSTDSQEILQSCAQFSLKTLELRPPSLANDHSTVTQVLEYEAKSRLMRGEFFDEIWQASCFSFMLTTTDLKRISARASELGDNELLLTVSKFPAPIKWALEPKGEGDCLVPVQASSLTLRSQDLKDFYFDSGNLAVFNSKIMYSESPELKKLDLIGFEVPPYKSIDVDTMEDMKLLEYIFLGRRFKQDLQG